jgi:hypothetical protein
VTSSPAGIDCGSDCAENYLVGTMVVLTAAPASGSTFAGWDGAGCSGTGTCSVTMSEARQVTATFGIQAETPGPTPPPPDDEPLPTPSPTPSPTPQPEPGPETADATPPVAAIASSRLRMSRRGFVRVRVDCRDSPEDCLGVLRVRLRLPRRGSAAALRTVGRASFKVVAGESKRVRVRLKRRARRVVRRKGRVRVRLVAVVEDAAGNERKLRKRLRLRATR